MSEQGRLDAMLETALIVLAWWLLICVCAAAGAGAFWLVKWAVRA